MRAAAVLVLVGLGAAPATGASVLAARTLPAGTVLTRADLAWEAGLPSLPAEGENFVGLETRRAIYEGRPVLRSDLGPATIVDRNTIVTLVYRTPGLEMRAEGRALDPGGLGEPVRVLNLDSRLTVTATVTAPAVVEVMR